MGANGGWRRCARRAVVGMAVATAGLTGGRSFALDATWTASGSGNWEVGSNWSSSPFFPTNPGDSALFPSASATVIVSLGTPVSVAALTFNTASSYTIAQSSSGGTLILSATSGPASIGVGNTLTAGTISVNVPIALASDLVLTNSATAVGGQLNRLAINGVISGSNGITVNGPGEVALGGNNANFSGNFLVTNGGTLTSGGAGFGSGAVEVDSGLLQIGATGFSAPPITTSLTLDGGAVAYTSATVSVVQQGGILISNSGTLSQTSNGASATLGGIISGAGTLTVAGHAFVASAANSFAGLLSLNATLTLSGAGSFTHVSETDVNAGGALRVGAAAGNVDGSNSVQAGSVVLKGGALDFTADLGPAAFLSASSTGGAIGVDVSNITFGGSNVLDLGALPGGGSMGVGTIRGGSIASSVDIRPGASNALHFVGLSASGSALTVNAPLSDHGGAMSVDVAAGAVITLAGNNTYTGQTTVEGALTVASNSGLGAGSGADSDGTVIAGGSLTVRSGVTIADEKIAIVSGGVINNSGVLNGPIVFSSSGTLTGTGGTFGGPISGSADFLLAGTITLSGNNSYSGTATVNAGSVTVLSSLPSAKVNGGTLTLSGPQAGAITLTGGEVDVNAATTGSFAVSGGTLNMNAAGSGSVTLTGGGVVLRDTVHSYADAISLTNANLVATGSALERVSGPVTANGNVTVFGEGTAPNAVDFAGGFSGAGVARLQGGSDTSGLLAGISASGGVQYTGALYLTGTFSAGSVHETGWLKLGFGSVAVPGGVSVTGDMYVSNVSTVTADAAVSGTVWDAGVLTVNDHLDAKRFVMQGGGGLAGTGDVHVDSGVLEIQSGGGINFGGTWNIGTVTMGGEQTVLVSQLPAAFSGLLQVQQGNLVMQNGGQGSNALIQVIAGGARVTLTNGTFTNSIQLMNAAGDGTGALIGSPTQPSTSILQGSLDVGTSGSTVGGTLTLAGGVTGGTLTAVGQETLTSTAALTGDVVVDGGVLVLQGDGQITGPGVVRVIGQGEVRLLARTGADRIGAGKSIALAGGRLLILGDTAGAVSTSETVGTVNVYGGNNEVGVTPGGVVAPGVVVSLTTGALQRSAGATVSFSGIGPSTGAPANNGSRLLITGQAPTDFMGGAYTANGLGFVKYDATQGVLAFTDADYWTGDETTWNATRDVWVGSAGSGATLTASRSIRSLRASQPVDLGSTTLNVGSGGVIATQIQGSAGNHLTAGGSASAAELFLYSGGTVSANITDNAGPDGQYDATPGGALDADNGHVSLVVSLASNQPLILSGTNTYTGGTFINSGTVEVTAASAIAPGNLTIRAAGSYSVSGSFAAAFGGIVLSGGGFGSGGDVSASSILIDSGTLTAARLLGNESLVKDSAGSAAISADLSQFTGSIDVNGGTLTLGTTVRGPITVDNGTLNLTTASLTGSLSLLAGSELEVQATQTVNLQTASTITPGARVVVNGTLLLSTADSLADSTDPTRRADVIDGGTVEVTLGNKTAGNVTGSGNLLVDAGASLSVNKLSLISNVSSSLNVSGTLVLRPEGPTSDVQAINLNGSPAAPNGTVDISNDRLVVRVSGSAALNSTIVTLQSYVAHARDGGGWDGTGITSSTAAADGAGGTIAVVDNGQLGLTMFGDAPVDDRSILLLETFVGDANLDHAVTVEDLARLAPFFGTTTSGGWADGDFNGDGKVDAADIEMLEPFYGSGTAGAIPSFADALASVGLAGAVPVPEAASLLMLSGSVLLVMRRRPR